MPKIVNFQSPLLILSLAINFSQIIIPKEGLFDHSINYILQEESYYNRTVIMSSLYQDINQLKNSYKIASPSLSWNYGAINCKIQPVQQSYKNSHLSSICEQTTSNPWTKTKQLFKNKNNSVVADDLINQNVFTAAKLLEEDNKHDNFEFDSFGQQNIDNLSKFKQKEQLRVWNSSSLQINFGKVAQMQLHLPQKSKVTNTSQQQNIFCLTKIENSDSSIKQFCFNLNQPLEQININQLKTNVITNTPIKRWKDTVRKKMSTSQTQRSQPKIASNKNTLRQIVYEFIDKLDQIPPQRITPSLINQTKNLFCRIQTQSQSSLCKKLFNKQTVRLKTCQDSSSTLSFSKTNAQASNLSRENSKAKFKIYETNKKLKYHEDEKKKKQVTKKFKF